MKKNILRFSFMILVFFIECKQDNTSSDSKEDIHKKESSYNGDTIILNRAKRIRQKQEPKPPLCIIFCDFTNSVDRKSKINICNNAEMILKKYYGSKELEFYLIDGMEYSKPFYKTFPVSANDSKGFKPSEKRRLARAIKFEQDSLQTILKAFHKDSLPYESFIVGAIAKAIRLFNNYDCSDGKRFDLILLSDMMEKSISAIGKIDLEDASYKEDIICLKNKFYPNVSFGFLNVKVTIAVSTNRKVLNVDSFNEFWQTVFGKYQYKDEIRLTSKLTLE